MRKSALVSILILTLTITAFGVNWRTGSLEEALAQAKAENKLLLLDFFTEYG